MDLSLSTTLFGPEKEKDDLLRWLEIIKNAGYSQVEISHKQQNLRKREKLIRNSGVKVWSIHGSVGYGVTSLSEDERRQAVEAEFAVMEDAACFAPCPYVVHYVDRFNNPAHGRAFKRSVAELHIKAVELGLILAVETAPYKPQENERYPDSAEIANFVRSFESPNLQATIDINHSNLHDELEDVCGNFRGIIANIHVSNNHGEWEDHLEPWNGVIDIPKTMKSLIANGYAGPCNLELHPSTIPEVDYLTNLRIRTEEMLQEI
jgi:sugar phosphate isomerase/epimerase